MVRSLIGQRGAPVRIETALRGRDSRVDALLVFAPGRADGDVGRIAPGRYGDIIAVRNDPLADIRVLGDVAVVIKGGLAFKLP